MTTWMSMTNRNKKRELWETFYGFNDEHRRFRFILICIQELFCHSKLTWWLEMGVYWWESERGGERVFVSEYWIFIWIWIQFLRMLNQKEWTPIEWETNECGIIIWIALTQKSHIQSIQYSLCGQTEEDPHSKRFISNDLAHEIEKNTFSIF